VAPTTVPIIRNQPPQRRLELQLALNCRGCTRPRRTVELEPERNDESEAHGILVASRGRHIVGLSPYVRKVPEAVRETEALWSVLINLVPELADAPERRSFELLRNECLCE